MINQLIQEMITYDTKDPKRIRHFIKVSAFAKLIGEEEGLDKEELETLSMAAEKNIFVTETGKSLLKTMF